MSEKKATILIDAYSQIFRVFYAIAHLSRGDGFPTNALFGFARLLMQIEKNYSPESGAMFFDCGKPAFRLELSSSYKSNRPPMPEALKQQMPLLRTLAGLFGWQTLECENYEADDLIGAAVKNDAQSQFAIISSDKDLSQLIDDHACMLIPGKSGGFEVRDEEAAIKKFAVTPSQIIDYLAMLGDSSDAVDGVPGIGPKTASAILHECNSLENFFADPEMLANGKQRSKLLENEELLKRNIKLITLRTQWPEKLGDLQKALEKRAPDWQKIAEFAAEYELKSILKELPVTAAETEEKLSGQAVCPVEEKVEMDDLFSWGTRQSENVSAVENKEQSREDKPVQGVLF